MTTPSCSVLVASHGASPLLEESLRRVAEQAHALGGEVVLVMNLDASELQPSKRARLAALVDRLLFEPRTGKSYALNTAIGQCRAEIIAFGDDDALPAEGWLAALLETMENAPADVAGCGGPVEPILPENAPSWFLDIFKRSRNSFIGPAHDLGDEPREYTSGEGGDTPIGANCAYRRSILLEHPYHVELGPNANTGLRGGEDTELGLRLVKAGYRLLYVPGARVRHPISDERMTLESVARAYRMQGVAEVRLRRIMGEAVDPPEQLQRKLRKHRLGDRLWRSLRPVRAMRHRLHCERYSGRLEETTRTGAS